MAAFMVNYGTQSPVCPCRMVRSQCVSFKWSYLVRNLLRGDLTAQTGYMSCLYQQQQAVENQPTTGREQYLILQSSDETAQFHRHLLL